MARGTTVSERVRRLRDLAASVENEAEFLALQAERIARRAAAYAKGREFLAFAGLTYRRKPGRLPKHEAKAFARIVAESDLTPWQLVDELLGALLNEYPEASPLDAARWLTARSEAGDHYAPLPSHIGPTRALFEKPRELGESPRCYSGRRVIIEGSGSEATAIAPSQARSKGGSAQ